MTDVTLPDKFHQRAITSLRSRHEYRIQENAERIQEQVGYLLKRVEAGRHDSTALIAEDIEAASRRIAASVAALEALNEGLAILATADEAETTGDPQ